MCSSRESGKVIELINFQNFHWVREKEKDVSRAYIWSYDRLKILSLSLSLIVCFDQWKIEEK